jgi:hypothetical protein
MQEMYKGSLVGSKKENLKDVKSAKTLFRSTPTDARNVQR